MVGSVSVPVRLAVVLTIGFPAAAFATNCYVLAPGAGQECLVVDPGIGVEDQLAEVLREHRLKPAAVLLTHGHLDHVYSVTPVCGAASVAAHIHGDDRYRLKDPLSLLDPSLVAMLEQQFGTAATWREPDDVVSLADQDTLELAGLTVRVLHAPGHTEGSVMFALPTVPDGVADSGLGSTAAVRRRALRRLHRSHRPARRQRGGDDPQPARRGPAAAGRHPGPARPRPRHHVERERAANPYLQGLSA